ncbi:hypothetical protein F2Q70_00014902 [Brassica cretica]|uniref:Uncharacterized protein n=1 Tax=Brassica cretica TaxID=69181 RepID=A0A8S9HX26_BRACR|nr:hypothetical protein F2Q70_00014902 [Brassica cretica]
MDIHQIQDELAKHNYEKLAQSDQVTTKKLDSVEKKIETMAIESTSRFEAIEKQMNHITDSNIQNGDNQKHETGANKENNPQQQQNNFKARLQYTTRNMSISSSLR